MNAPVINVALFGECMLELSGHPVGPTGEFQKMQLGFGGDTLNTAVYLAPISFA